VRFFLRKPHDVNQRQESRREIRGSAVDGPVVSFSRAYVLGAGLGTINFLRLSSSLGRSVFPVGNLLKLRM